MSRRQLDLSLKNAAQAASSSGLTAHQLLTNGPYLRSAVIFRNYENKLRDVTLPGTAQSTVVDDSASKEVYKWALGVSYRRTNNFRLETRNKDGKTTKGPVQWDEIPLKTSKPGGRKFNTAATMSSWSPIGIAGESELPFNNVTCKDGDCKNQLHQSQFAGFLLPPCNNGCVPLTGLSDSAQEVVELLKEPSLWYKAASPQKLYAYIVDQETGLGAKLPYTPTRSWYNFAPYQVLPPFNPCPPFGGSSTDSRQDSLLIFLRKHSSRDHFFISPLDLVKTANPSAPETDNVLRKHPAEPRLSPLRLFNKNARSTPDHLWFGSDLDTRNEENLTADLALLTSRVTIHCPLCPSKLQSSYSAILHHLMYAHEEYMVPGH